MPGVCRDGSAEEATRCCGEDDEGERRGKEEPKMEAERSKEVAGTRVEYK